MKIAFISDIHSNLHALDLVLDDISNRNIDKIICLGDILVKYLYPKEVLKLVQDNCQIVIKGNCDELVATNEIYKFARNQIGIDGIEYLNNLPVTYQVKINKILLNLYHSNPKDLESVFNPLFIDNKPSKHKQIIKDYNEMFINNKSQVVIVGHTHQDFIAKVINNKLEIINNNIIKLNNNDKYIINVGSVGEHDHMINNNLKYRSLLDDYITYMIFDSDNNTSQIIKIPYKEKLLEVYFDFKNKQNDDNIPNTPNYLRRIEDSLIDMGYDKKDLILKK
ncbi:MAG: metallophosphoesterase family protein [Bacilli bacterium]|nr:metallophosphoesterase family protein [Bacilli bacterium]